jgi:competence protein ComEC
MAKSVLLPFFDANRINTIDYVFLSHFDNDHAGGIDVITKELNVKRVLSPKNACNREAFLLKNPSGRGKFLSFTVQILWPLKPSSGNENNQSCVIKLEKGKHSILLTGDIENQVEAQLVSMYQDTDILQTDILIAPHHGSKTSSSLNFLSAVNPKYAIFTSGNHNRWDFPSQIVLNRYQKIGAKIRIKLNIDKGHIAVSRYRIDEYQRWYFSAR